MGPALASNGPDSMVDLGQFPVEQGHSIPALPDSQIDDNAITCVSGNEAANKRAAATREIR